MATQQSETKITFLRGKHDLTKLLKQLEGITKEAVEVLESTMRESKDVKLKVECAKQIINFTMATSKQISDEDMARLIAEVRLSTPANPKVGAMLQAEERKVPQLDFSTVRDD